MPQPPFERTQCIGDPPERLWISAAARLVELVTEVQPAVASRYDVVCAVRAPVIAAVAAGVIPKTDREIRWFASTACLRPGIRSVK